MSYKLLVPSLLIAFGQASIHSPSGLCERIHPEDLPEECICSEPRPLGLVLECLKPFENEFFNDTIGMVIDIDPCNEYGSSISVNVTELDHNIRYMIAGVRAGEEQLFPLPGMSVAVPTLGHVGLDADILIYGNPDQLTLKVGLNACAVVGPRTICASAIPGLNRILPWWVLSGTYSFGDVCNATLADLIIPHVIQ